MDGLTCHNCIRLTAQLDEQQRLFDALVAASQQAIAERPALIAKAESADGLASQLEEAERKGQAEATFWERKVHAAESQLTALREHRRINIERQADGTVMVCFGDHENGTGCAWQTFVPNNELTALRVALTEVQVRAIATCEREGFGIEDTDDMIAIKGIVESALSVSPVPPQLPCDCEIYQTCAKCAPVPPQRKDTPSWPKSSAPPRRRRSQDDERTGIGRGIDRPDDTASR